MQDRIVLQGILYDKKSSFLWGAGLTPHLILEACQSVPANYFAENGMELRPEIFNDAGDFIIENYFEIEKIAAKNLAKNLPLITLGGDHSITYHKIFF